LLLGCCTKPPARKQEGLRILQFAGLLGVGDAGFEPATSAV
jgi:hypothetical protein